MEIICANQCIITMCCDGVGNSGDDNVGTTVVVEVMLVVVEVVVLVPKAPQQAP